MCEFHQLKEFKKSVKSIDGQTALHKQEFLIRLKQYVYNNFGKTMYKKVLDLEIHRIKNQNKIQIPFILKFIKIRKNLKLLDIGCGFGGATVAWSLKGLKCVGIDMLEEDLKIARLRAKSKGVRPIFLKVNSTKIPFSTDSFDIIICDQVLEHTPNFKKTISEMKRIAQKNAIIYIDIPNKFFPIEPHYNLFFVHWLPKKIQKYYIKLRRRKQLYYPIKILTYFELKKEIKKNNLEIVATTKEYINNTLDYSCLKNVIAKILNTAGVPFYLFSPTIQFILRKK
jgi:ubiquinone/menaquinone biosynthesis C-methylase UbiE